MDIAPQTAALAGDARFSGVIARVMLPRAVAHHLPPGFEPGDGGESDSCDAIVLFGEQRHGASIRGGIPLPLSRSFYEFGVILPHVRRSGEATADRACVLRMASSYRAVVSVGNREYGFHKTLARVEASEGWFAMSDAAGRLQFCGQAQATGNWSRLRAMCGPVVDAIDVLRERTVVGCRVEGTVIESRFEWDFSAALVRPVAVQMTIDPALGLTSAPWQCETGPGEALEVGSMAWGLTWPRATRA